MSLLNYSKIINLSCANANSSNYPMNSICEFINNFLDDNNDALYVNINLIHAEIPVSYFILNEYNNGLYISVNGVLYYISLTLGNYSSSSFSAMFISLLNAKNIGVFTMIINTATGQFKLSCATTTTSFVLNPNLLSTCGGLFGFKNSTDTCTSVNAAFTFLYPADLLGFRNIKLCTNISTKNVDSSQTSSNGLLNVIPVNSPPYGLIQFSNYSNFSNKIDSQNISKLIIYLYNENNQLINFNGIHWSLTLQITEFFSPTILTKKISLSSLMKETNENDFANKLELLTILENENKQNENVPEENNFQE